MSRTFARPRTKRTILALAWSALLALVLGLLLLALTVPPTRWWPETGQAFAVGAPPRPLTARGSETCDLIVGPAHDYCLAGISGAAPPEAVHLSGLAPRRLLMLAPVVLALACVARRRHRPQEGPPSRTPVR